MNNLINRSAAIDGLDALLNKHRMVTTNWYRSKDYFDAVSDAFTMLQNLPSIQPQRWTPVSDALPEDLEEVIVTCLDDSGDTPFSYTTVAWHYKDMWVCDNEWCPFVIAWMPLPEPYKEGQDATN